MKKKFFLKPVTLITVFLVLLIVNSCKKDKLEPPISEYIGYISSTQDSDGEFSIDADGDGDIDGYATCLNSAMATEINNHINPYTWAQNPYVKVRAKLTDAAHIKYQVTAILGKGIGGY